MSGKVVLITGGTSGIGRSAAFGLAEKNMTVIIHGRSAERLSTTVAEVRKFTSNKNVFSLQADLSNLSEVRRLAKMVKEQYPRLNIMVNNAGAIYRQREKTVDGYEKTFQVNYLAPFLLTNLLLDRLKANAPSTVINVSAGQHAQGAIHFDDLQLVNNFSRSAAYNQSKLALLMFTYALARRTKGTGVTVNAVNPGWVVTGLNSNLGPVVHAGKVFAYLFGRSPEKGAKSIVHLATLDEAERTTGKYYYDNHELRSSDEAGSVEAQERLWTVSEALVHLEGAPTATAPNAAAESENS